MNSEKKVYPVKKSKIFNGTGCQSKGLRNGRQTFSTPRTLQVQPVREVREKSSRRVFLGSIILLTILFIGFIVPMFPCSHVPMFPCSNVVLAWTPPGAPPPGDNVAKPVNIGPDAQGKTGNLGIGTATPSDYVLDVWGSGRFTSDLTAPIIYDGIYYLDPGSDAFSLYVLGSVTALGTTDDNYFAGNVGIGISNPAGLLDVNSKLVVTDQQVTINVPLNLAAAGDVSIASDLQFTSPTASYIRSYAPLYIESGDPSQNVDLVLKASNAGVVIVDDTLKITTNMDANNYKIVNLATPTADSDAATMAYVETYVDSSMVAGDNDWFDVAGGNPTLAGNIYHTGDVGIGTDTEPTADLDVYGNIETGNSGIITADGGFVTGSSNIYSGSAQIGGDLTLTGTNGDLIAAGVGKFSGTG
ncbi:hypothetical protein ISS21_03090, partial [Patescibacteria group bacterium]|nr:hypothetical protein [Patescibacteria group bacterium]